MPGFISHTVMANDVCDKIKNELVDRKYMVTYSLGGDLTKYAKCRYDTHHKLKDEFIKNMAKYIKEHNLVTDKEVMGVLYGHICHYAMDDIVHPLVGAVSKKCLRKKYNHTLIEVYYDKYFVDKKYNEKVTKYLKRGILKGRVKKKISDMLDYVYMVTYETENITKYYKFNLWLYRRLKNIYIIWGYNINGINKFVKQNKEISLDNGNHLIAYKNHLGKVSTDSLMEVYNTSVDKAIKQIRDINRYLNI